MEDSILTVIITILVTLIAIVSQIRKKGSGQGSAGKPARDIFSEPFPTQIPDNPEEVIRRFFGEQPAAPAEDEAEPASREGEFNPEPVYETYTGEDLQEPEELAREKAKILSEEGIPATIHYSSEAEKEAFADTSVTISADEISGSDSYAAQSGETHPLLQKIDWQKAVLYSEILNRKNYF